MSNGNFHSRFTTLAIPVSASILYHKYSAGMDAPFVALLLVAFLWTIAIALLLRSDGLRAGVLLCSSVLFSLAVIETGLYFVSRSQIIVTQTTPAMWRQNVPGLGSLPMPNSVTEFKELVNGQLIADVTYKIDASRLREIPASVQGRPHKIAFFGCSFMFGHGVENNQTLPYYFVREAKGSFEGFNFAGEGWGPHQMLREIETGFVQRVAGTPDLAIYEAIPDHLRRVAGRAPWEDGPRYKLCLGDEVCYSGPFHTTHYEIYRRWLEKSWTVKFLENHLTNLSRPSDIPLFLAVMKKTRSLLEENGTRFVIVLWDQNELAKSMMKALKASQFDVIAVSSAVPQTDRSTYPLTQLDQHPSPATNKVIAAYLWEHLAKQLPAN
jgi:hypothetical protein